MFLKLNHQNLEAYKVSQSLLVDCYKISYTLPDHENFNMISQLRRAALSNVLNIAEGASRKSETERKRFFEIARGSVVEIDAILDAAAALDYLKNIPLDQLGLIYKTHLNW
ncbi:four helix bundle protein [Niabella yanshanensis]|uniref:Four helix bundle protein n=1 Tax=Niabella yanshanensis TaxID=577386 RepID=A0ABZ0W782_9BACT|nr:four helix bundle protein [Niabella yanshanensis]WQD37382.1 four helix bundle protein [Niabella yanshanensis]